MTTTAGPAGLHEPEAGTHAPSRTRSRPQTPSLPPGQTSSRTCPAAARGGPCWRHGWPDHQHLADRRSGRRRHELAHHGPGRPGRAGRQALSVATGQYVAVSSYNELVRERARKQTLELLFRPDAEEKELGSDCGPERVATPESIVLREPDRNNLSL